MKKRCGGEVVVGLGELLWDVLPGGRQLGGAPANFAYHARALGAAALAISAVGDDALGVEALEQLEAGGNDIRGIQVLRGVTTGRVDVRVDAQGKPQFEIQENVAWDGIEYGVGLAGLAGQAEAVCFGSLAQRAAVSAASIRRFVSEVGPGCVRIFDVNLRAPFFGVEVIERGLGLCGVLKLNDEELPVLGPLLGLGVEEAGFWDGVRERYGVGVMALTRGAEGASLFFGGDRLDFPAVRLGSVVDTVGAGDSFTAVLAVGLLRGRPLLEIGRLAVRVAAEVCSHAGAMPRMEGFYGRMFGVGGEFEGWVEKG